MRNLLTKTLYIDGLRCPKLIWQNINLAHLKEKPTTSDQVKIEEGYFVEDEFKKVFKLEGIKNKEFDILKSVKKTKNLLKTNNIVYEASFSFKYNSLLCYIRVDVLVKNEDGTYSVYEIKSSSNEKESQLEDIAFQNWVLSQNKIIIKDFYLVTLNKDYVKLTEENTKELFNVTNHIEMVNENFNTVTKNVHYLENIMNTQLEPNISIGPQCNVPFKCSFSHICKKHLNIDSIDNISRLSAQKKAFLEASNIKYIREIPVTFELTEKQKIQRKVAITNQHYIDYQGIVAHLEKIKFPLNFLDFEAYTKAIPIFLNSRPNQFIPFQASLHKVFKTRKNEHKEFLHLEKNDPREGLIKFLIENLNNNGSIVVYNKAFEISRLKDLQRDFPIYAENLQSIIDRVWDLADIFNHYYYAHEFGGSYSIKNVLPVLAPELDYKRLEISNGDEAQAFYRNLINNKYKGIKRNKIKNALLKYCELDTYAMIRLLFTVCEKIEKPVKIKHSVEYSY